MALLAVLALLLVVVSSSVSFIWFMNQMQARAGARYRSAAALSMAEAGVHRALSILETVTPDGLSPGRAWRAAGYAETVTVGAFQGRLTVSLTDDADGSIQITSAGEVAGVTRRLRARVHLASPALMVALYGTSLVRFDRPSARMAILPYGGTAGDRPWIHIASGAGIGFASTDVSLNDPLAAFDAAPGPADPVGGTSPASRPPAQSLIRLLLARGAVLTLGQDHQPVDVQQLRTMGVRIEGVVLRAEALPTPPEVDRAYLQSMARFNTANAALNAVAGKYTGDADLARKPDSLYSRDQFERLLVYLRTGQRLPSLRGVIYVDGEVTVPEQQQIAIEDGALIVAGMLRLGQSAGLQVIHSTATRTLPGLVILDGALLVTQRARLRAHGLVYVSRVIDLWEGSHLDVVGAVVGNDRGLSFRNLAATAVIRYDPAVLGTPGLRVADDAPVVVWVSAWEELP